MPDVEHVGAEEVGLVGLGDGAVEDVGDLPVLAADEDERVPGADGERRDRDALDQLMRVLHHQLAVLERARLGLVGVAAHVLAHLAAGQERALLAHREAGAAAAAQAGVLEASPSRSAGSSSRERPLERPVAAAAPVAVDRRQLGLVDVAEQHPASQATSVPSRRGSGGRLGAAGGRARCASLLLRQRLGAGAQGLDRGERVGAVERAVVALVDRGHRRDVAGAEALEALDEELAVGRARPVVVGLVVVGSGGLAERLEQLVAAPHPAGDVVADEHPVAADRRGREQVVEARDRLQVGRGHAHHRRRLADALGRAPAVVALHRPERRDRGRAQLRVARHRLLDLLAQLGRDVDLVQLGHALGVRRPHRGDQLPPLLGREVVGRLHQVRGAESRDAYVRSVQSSDVPDRPLPRIGSSIPRFWIRSAT